MKHMIEIDWDKIRENTLKLVCGYRDTYAGKEWKCRELQEKNGQIRTEIERIFKYIQSSNSELLNITVRQSRQSGVARATCPD